MIPIDGSGTHFSSTNKQKSLLTSGGLSVAIYRAVKSGQEMMITKKNEFTGCKLRITLPVNPKGYPLSCKRICFILISFASFTQENLNPFNKETPWVNLAKQPDLFHAAKKFFRIQIVNLDSKNVPFNVPSTPETLFSAATMGGGGSSRHDNQCCPFSAKEIYVKFDRLVDGIRLLSQ
jgi:hypothetical protein